MPGISGLIPPRGRELQEPREVLDAFTRVQALPGVNYVERRLATPRAAISVTLTGLLPETLDQPATDAVRGAHLFLEGEVHNTDELERLCGLPPGTPPPRTLLALFLARGPEAAALCDGAFNLAIWEEPAQRLTVMNDRLSTKPFYHLEENGTLIFASEKKCVLAARTGETRIDPVGLLQIFAHYHNIAGRTFIDGLRRLPPASCLSWENGRLSTWQYERMRIATTRRLPRVPDLIAEWCDCLRADVARRVRGKKRLLIFLSGGLDSRAVACAIPRDFRPVAARTRGPADSLEVRCATQVAQRLGIDHFREDPEDMPYSAVLGAAAWRAECEISLLNCMSLADHPRIKAHGDIILGGHSGATLTGGQVFLYLLWPRSHQAFLDRVFRAYAFCGEGLLERIFQKDFVRRNLPLVREEFRASFDSYEGERNADTYQVWNLLERQPRMTLAPGAVDSPLFEKLYALLGRDSLNFQLQLPLRLRYGKVLYQAMISSLGPELRGIPYANNGLPVRSTVFGNRVNKVIELGAKARKYAWRKLRRKTGKVRAAALSNVASALRSDPGIREAITDYLNSPAFDGAIFRREGILSLLDEHASGQADRATVICYLATLATGLPWFVHERPRGCPEGVWSERCVSC